MDVASIQFGTDGWRALLGSGITTERVAVVCQAYADYLEERSPAAGVAVGFDGRSQSGEFALTASRVLAANGFEVFRSDSVIPTPVLSFAVRSRRLAAGIMITASHNPPTYNGVKFKGPYGGPLMTEETGAIERLLGRSSVHMASHAPPPADLLAPYLEHIGTLVSRDALRGAGFAVAVDSMGGAGGDILASFLRPLGVSVVTVDDRPSHDFRGRIPEPIESNLAPLAEVLRTTPGMCFGVATDGDADRCGALLENGSWLSAQEIILLLVDYVLKSRKEEGDVVKTASVTDKVRTVADAEGRRVHDVQVGFKYVAERMIRNPVAFGCEESGGFGYGMHLPERDGILSALLMAEMLATSGCRTLGEYWKRKERGFGEVYYRRIDRPYEQPDRSDLLPSLLHRSPSRIGTFRVSRIDRFDSSRGVVNGIKFGFEGQNRWLLIRSSETEPMVRLYAEGQSDDEVTALLSAATKLLSL